MADISDERLREIIEGTYCGFDEGAEISAELLAARMRIKSDEEHLPTIGKMAKDLAETEDELDAARAEVAEAKRLDSVRLAQIASLQKIIRNDTTPAGVEVARFRAELIAARADLREAMELLDAVTDKEPETQAQRWLLNRVNALLAKHKETP